MKQLGIMVSNVNAIGLRTPSHYTSLSIQALRSKVCCIFFSPIDINWQTKRVNGYIYHPTTQQWLRRCLPLPKLIYDRCFNRAKQQYEAHRQAITYLRRGQHARLLGQPLPSKWTVYKWLQQQPDLQPYLPLTERYVGKRSLVTWFAQRDELFLKPRAGSHGKGMLYVKRSGHEQFTIIGRNKRYHAFQLVLPSSDKLFRLLQRVTKRRPYLMQTYLALTTPQNEPYDIRSFIQKNDRGHWQHTGIAMRRGARGSIIANLHGGGKAEPLIPYLSEVFGTDKALQLQQTIVSLSYKIATCLEHHFGHLLELGLDFGIDLSGSVWLLEANSKPGRAIFEHLQLHDLREHSIRMSIEYARFILERQLGG